MSERHNTILYAFDQQNPHVTAYDIHECIQDTMCLREDDVAMIQIDDYRRHIYINFVTLKELRGIGNSVTRTVKSPRYELKQ
jgi:hypothetical protein